MNICFERRAERPDAQKRCVIRLVATFENQRLRLATKEKCLASEWNEDKGWFRKSFPDIDNAEKRLKALRKKVDGTYSDLRTKLGGPVSVAGAAGGAGGGGCAGRGGGTGAGGTVRRAPGGAGGAGVPGSTR